MSAPVVAVDIETTGLAPGTHEAWEVAIVRRSERQIIERVWQFPVDVARADPVALELSRYRERVDANRQFTVAEFVTDFADLTDGAWFVAANPSFDVGFLERAMRLHGREPGWRYRLVCVENLVAGLTRTLPAGLRDAARAVGIDTDGYDRHTALGDARLALDVFTAVLGDEPRELVLSDDEVAPRSPEPFRIPPGAYC